jgi:hypothetical protein
MYKTSASIVSTSAVYWLCAAAASGGVCEGGGDILRRKCQQMWLVGCPWVTEFINSQKDLIYNLPVLGFCIWYSLVIFWCFADRASWYNLSQWPTWCTNFQYIYYNPLHVHVSSDILLILRSSNCTNTVNAELNPICHLLALLEAHTILHVSGVRVNTASGIVTYWQWRYQMLY